MTRPAREAFLLRFERDVDPEGRLRPAERRRRANNALRAHMARLASKSPSGRRKSDVAAVAPTERAGRYSRAAYLQSRGLSLDEYDAVLEQQGGLCALCGEPPAKGSLYVDQAASGELRGLLCPRCSADLRGWERLHANPRLNLYLG